jgi:hypothetical protein
MQRKSMVMAEHCSRRADTRRHTKKALGELDKWLKNGTSWKTPGQELGRLGSATPVENSKKPK